MGRLHALLILAWALARSLFATLLGARRGIADFQRSYAADRLSPLSEEERRVLPKFSGCLACGLCDAGEGAAMVRSAGRHPGAIDPMLATPPNIPPHPPPPPPFSPIPPPP